MRLLLYVLAIFIAYAAPIQAQASPVEIDRYITNELPKSGMPGTSIALIESGDIVFSRGYGSTGSAGLAVNADTPFQVASLSKSFTALCVLQLVDEGRLDLDTPIIRYLPDFRTREKAQSDRITIRHLLMHRSGFETVEGIRNQAGRYQGKDALSKEAARLRKTKLASQPGEAFMYSNANYAILGHLLEQIDEKPFEDILNRRIFEPLNMRNSYVLFPTASTGTEAEAKGHHHWFGLTFQKHFIAGRLMAPSAGVVSSANDMGKYIAAMSTPQTDLISAEMREEMFSGQLAWGDTYYGMGWGMTRDEHGMFISHEGLNPGFKSVAGFYKETGTGVVVLTNRSSGLSDNFALAILDAAKGHTPRDHTPNWVAIATLTGLLVAAFLLCCGAILSVFRLFRASDCRVKTRSTFHQFSIPLVGAVCLFAIGYGFISIIPGLNGVTLSSMYKFYPDLAACLGFAGGAALLWGLSISLKTWRLAYSAS